MIRVVCLVLTLSSTLFAMKDDRNPKLFLLFDALDQDGNYIGAESYWDKKYKKMFKEHGYNPEMIIRSDFQKLSKRGDLFISVRTQREKNQDSGKHFCKLKLALGFVQDPQGENYFTGEKMDKVSVKLAYVYQSFEDKMTLLPWSYKCSSQMKEAIKSMDSCTTLFERVQTWDLSFKELPAPCVEKN